MAGSFKWWQTAVFYQIYPRSFADGNGDGIGDLQGMLDKLDYLQDLGIDAIWLSPHFPSPQVDWGYDVSDYRGVAPEYGSMDLFKQYLDEVHKRGMHLILDLVLNHTSDQHAWFVESRSSKGNPKRDWYIWRKGKNGGPPNNWYSTFGGGAWEYDPQTDEWYYHFFFKEQPDLNWRNPEVKQAMFDVVRFWLEMGVDGFRLDAIGTIYEDPEMLDYPVLLDLDDLYRMERSAESSEEHLVIANQRETVFHYQHDQPGIHELMRELRAVVNEYPDRVLVGETDDIRFYGNGDDELHLNFNFPLMWTDRLTPAWIRANQTSRLSKLPEGAWPCNTLGNHDSPRMYSHFGVEGREEETARLNLALLLTMWGTPFLYNGEEVGMRDYCFDQLEWFRDPLSFYAFEMEIRVVGSSREEALHHAANRGRDKCRTPMQWSNEPNGGFSPVGVETWLPVNPDYSAGVNVEEQQKDPDSLWNYYRALLRLRKQIPALQEGDYKPIQESSKDTFAFARKTETQTAVIVLNYSDQVQTVRLGAGHYETKFSSHSIENKVSGGKLILTPFEVWIGEKKE